MDLRKVIFILTISVFSEESNILAVFPIPSKSHHVMFQAIIKGLINKGHNVTLVSPYEINANFTQIVVHTSSEKFLGE